MTRLGLISLVTLAVIAAAAVLGPILWTIDPSATDPAHRLADPSALHPFAGEA